ncbi:lactonase family protein [Arthrobacter sp. U41]|uniref:lactonase family protein n=1 Tax=Arthrobacter sp. U41 TaxID=1849032 RepID=UPI0021B669C3|nr:lactonase family protein [Arthrobacter sp. U41]
MSTNSMSSGSSLPVPADAPLSDPASADAALSGLVPPDELIWTGCYTTDRGGRGTGVGALRVTADGTLEWLGVAAAADSPSFLAVHPTLDVVYAVGEAAGTVRAYRRSGGFSLVPAGRDWPAGEAACHVAVDPQGRFVVVTCWGDGQVLLYELDDDGGITARYPAAASLVSGRPSRAHASLMLDDGRVMTTDLGHDLLRVWNYVPSQGLQLDHELALPRDSGPRHLVQHPGGRVLVVTEYSIEVAVVQLSRQSGIFSLAGVVPATREGALPGDSAAEIALSPDGRHAYVGVRGSNRITVLDVDNDGGVRARADVPSGGDWPRHHLVRNGRLHVAHERSGDVVTYPLDPASGLPGEAVGRVALASPTALVPAAR